MSAAKDQAIIEIVMSLKAPVRDADWLLALNKAYEANTVNAQLLAALRSYVSDAGLRAISRDDPRHDAARIAIAKAEGV